MEAFIKGFLGVFLFAMITYIAAGTISAELDSSKARSYMEEARSEISNANLAPKVIDAVGSQASEEGYELTVTAYCKGKGSREASYKGDSQGSIGDTGDAQSVELVLKYPYRIPILGVKNTHEVRGYAN